METHRNPYPNEVSGPTATDEQTNAAERMDVLRLLLVVMDALPVRLSLRKFIRARAALEDALNECRTHLPPLGVDHGRSFDGADLILRVVGDIREREKTHGISMEGPNEAGPRWP